VQRRASIGESNIVAMVHGMARSKNMVLNYLHPQSDDRNEREIENKMESSCHYIKPSMAILKLIHA